MSFIRRFLTYWCLFLFGSLSLLAQVSGSLKGRVLDTSGAAVAGAHVELKQSSTNITQSTTSTSEGYYSFSQLNPGVYQLEVTASGFQRLTRKGITVITGTTGTVDLALTVGSDQQSVTVTADAPLLQVETSNIQTNIPGHTIVAMPLNTRNFIQLAPRSRPASNCRPERCCRASTEAARAPTSISTTASPPCSPSPDRSPSSPSSTTSRSSPSKPTTCPPSSAASTAASSTSPPAPAPTTSTAASSSSCATRT